jgi:hypothetical protein
VKSLAVLALVAALTAACAHPATPPGTIYLELVDAGCLAPSGDGPEAIAQATAQTPRSAWLDCLTAGGTVGACHVPCD